MAFGATKNICNIYITVRFHGQMIGPDKDIRRLTVAGQTNTVIGPKMIGI